MLTDFRLDYHGVRQVLRGEDVRLLIDATAEDVHARVKAQLPADVAVVVNKYTTDRGAAAVTIADVRAMAWQARDGVLTRAAGEAGLEIKEWRQ